MLRFTSLIFLIAVFGCLGSRAHIIDDTAFHNPRKLVGDSVTGRISVETLGVNKFTPEEEKKQEFWRSLAHEELLQNVQKQQLNTNKAKNIIMFLGDGMSLTTLTAARILKGQRNNRTGEEDALNFQKFPHMALSRVRGKFRKTF